MRRYTLGQNVEIPTLEDVRNFIAQGSGLDMKYVIEANQGIPVGAEPYCTVLETRDYQVGYEGESRSPDFTEIMGKIRQEREGEAETDVPPQLQFLRSRINASVRFTLGTGNRARTYTFTGINTSQRSNYPSVAGILEEKLREHPDLNDAEVFFEGNRFHFRFPRGGEVEFEASGFGSDIGGDMGLGMIPDVAPDRGVIVETGSGRIRYNYINNRKALLSVQFFRDSKDHARQFLLWTDTELSQQMQNVLNFKLERHPDSFNADEVTSGAKWEGRTVINLAIAYIDSLEQAFERIEIVDIETNRDLIPPPVQQFRTTTTRGDTLIPVV